MIVVPNGIEMSKIDLGQCIVNLNQIPDFKGFINHCNKMLATRMKARYVFNSDG